MLKLKINNNDVEVEEGLTVLQACEMAGKEIPSLKPLPVRPHAMRKKEVGEKKEILLLN